MNAKTTFPEREDMKTIMQWVKIHYPELMSFFHTSQFIYRINQFLSLIEELNKYDDYRAFEVLVVMSCGGEWDKRIYKGIIYEAFLSLIEMHETKIDGGSGALFNYKKNISEIRRNMSKTIRKKTTENKRLHAKVEEKTRAVTQLKNKVRESSNENIKLSEDLDKIKGDFLTLKEGVIFCRKKCEDLKNKCSELEEENLTMRAEKFTTDTKFEELEKENIRFKEKEAEISYLIEKLRREEKILEKRKKEAENNKKGAEDATAFQETSEKFEEEKANNGDVISEINDEINDENEYSFEKEGEDGYEDK